jgi:hypothetical protein
MNAQTFRIQCKQQKCGSAMMCICVVLEMVSPLVCSSRLRYKFSIYVFRNIMVQQAYQVRKNKYNEIVASFLHGITMHMEYNNKLSIKNNLCTNKVFTQLMHGALVLHLKLCLELVHFFIAVGPCPRDCNGESYYTSEHEYLNLAIILYIFNNTYIVIMHVIFAIWALLPCCCDQFLDFCT